MHYQQEARCPEGKAHQQTIVIVEDDEAIGEVLALFLAQETSYETIVVSTGAQALYIAQERRVDLFLIDYYLCGMNGIELYDKLQATADLHTIPLLLTSAKYPVREGTLPSCCS